MPVPTLHHLPQTVFRCSAAFALVTGALCAQVPEYYYTPDWQVLWHFDGVSRSAVYTAPAHRRICGIAVEVDGTRFTAECDGDDTVVTRTLPGQATQDWVRIANACGGPLHVDGNGVLHLAADAWCSATGPASVVRILPDGTVVRGLYSAPAGHTVRDVGSALALHPSRAVGSDVFALVEQPAASSSQILHVDGPGPFAFGQTLFNCWRMFVTPAGTIYVTGSPTQGPRFMVPDHVLRIERSGASTTVQTVAPPWFFSGIAADDAGNWVATVSHGWNQGDPYLLVNGAAVPQIAPFGTEAGEVCVPRTCAAGCGSVALPCAPTGTQARRNGEAVVRIGFDTGNGILGTGTGFVVDANAAGSLLLTAEHVVREALAQPGGIQRLRLQLQVDCFCNTNRRSTHPIEVPVTAIPHADATLDFALLQTGVDLQAHGAVVATLDMSGASANAPVYAIHHGAQDDLGPGPRSHAAGQITALAPVPGTCGPVFSRAIFTDATTRPSSSGAPLFSAWSHAAIGIVVCGLGCPPASSTVAVPMWAVVRAAQAHVPAGFSLRVWGGFEPFGQGLAGTGGFVPTLVGTGQPVPSQLAELHVFDALGGTLGVLLASPNLAPTPLLGGTVFPDLGAAITFWHLATGAAGQAGAGTFSLPIALPANLPTGVRTHVQALYLDSAAVQGVAISNALRLVVQ